MNYSDNPQPEQLVDYHLGLLDGPESERVRRKIAGSEQLGDQLQNLNRWLEPLDAYRTPPSPSGLADRIMHRVEQSSPLSVTGAVSSLPPSSEGGVFRRPVLSFRELVALAACLTFFIGVIVPGFSRARSNQRRAVCANNLGNVYRGVNQYAENFNWMMPQTAGFSPGVNWLRSPQPKVRRVPNSRNRYLVVRLRFAKPTSFICPAVDDAQPMNADAIDQFDDFPSPENCSFDSQNMAGPTLPLPIGSANHLPIYADRNPLFDGGKLNAVNPLETNSRSHDGGSGQNVLCADGQVLWTTTPMFGPRGDNIWQADGITTYDGTEYQQHPADAFIIP